jgi:hypothetical protein
VLLPKIEVHLELAFLIGLRIIPSMSAAPKFLSAMEAGDPKAADELLPLVYERAEIVRKFAERILACFCQGSCSSG